MAKIYRIVGDNGVYIGSTKLTLAQRFSKHKSDCNGCASAQLINPRIELIEEIDENDRYIREQYWMDITDCVNKHNAPSGLTKEEYNRQYHQDHREQQLEYERRYRQNHRDQVLERMRKYRRDHRDEIRAHANTKIECECGCIISRKGKAKHLRTKKHQEWLAGLAPN